MNAKTAKAVNYTEEQTANMEKAYTESPTSETVNALAVSMGKSARSIIAKLSRMGIYKKAEYVSKTGATPVKKESLADKIAAVVGLNEADADSLTKANKTALAKILEKLEG